MDGIYKISADASTASQLIPTAFTTTVVLYGSSVGKAIRTPGVSFSAELSGPYSALMRKYLLKHRVR
jgi:hypothetical protein